MPLRHQDTKRHKELNIRCITLVNPWCLGVLVATCLGGYLAENGFPEMAQYIK